MDTFKIICIIFMIIVIYQIYQINCVVFKDKFEGFEGTAQSLGGVDDTNAINTLAQIAKNLMAGGVTVPGNMNIQGDLVFPNQTTIKGAGRLHVGGEELLYVLNKKGVMVGKEWGGTGDLTVQGNTNIGGGLTAGGTSAVPVLHLGNKFRLSGVGDAHGNDDWIRLFGVDNKGYHGGIAMNKCHIQTADFNVAGRNILAELDALKSSITRPIVVTSRWDDGAFMVAMARHFNRNEPDGTKKDFLIKNVIQYIYIR